MIKILFNIIYLFILFSISLYSSNLIIQPDKPIENREITFLYYADKNLEPTEIKLILYLFKTGSIEPEGIELELFSQDSIFTNKFHINKDVVFVLIKVFVGEGYDNNLQEFWDFIIYDEDSKKPKKDAFYFKAYSYLGSLPENCQRLTSFTKAIEYFEEELKLYPNNNTALLSLLLLKYDRRRISESDFRSSIKKIYDYDRDNLDEPATILLIRALNLLKEDKKAEKVENSFIVKYPSSKLAQENKLRQLSMVTDFQDFNLQAFEFLNKYKNSHITEKIWIALIQSYLQNNKLQEIISKVFEYENIPHSIYIRLAFNVLKYGKSYSDHELGHIVNDLVAKALSKINEDIKYQKPSYYSKSEWEKISRVNLSKFYQEWGDLLSLLNKETEALEKYLKAIEYLKSDYPISLTESAIIQATKINQDSLAFQIAQKAILDSKTTNFIDSVYFNLQSRYKFENHIQNLDSLKKIAVIKRKLRISQNLINVKSDFTLQTTDNSIINLNNYKGNTIILVLWAKWCDPCLDVLTFFEKFDRNSFINKDIIVFLVNTLDSDFKSNLNYLKQNKISTNYYIDINDEISSSLGLSGLPVTIFIDKRGIIRYIEKGYPDKSSFEQLLNDLIKILS